MIYNPVMNLINIFYSYPYPYPILYILSLSPYTFIPIFISYFSFIIFK